MFCRLQLNQRVRKVSIILLARTALLILLIYSSDSRAQSEFTTSEKFVEDIVLERLPISTTIAFAPDSKIFVALKDGIVRVVQEGTLLPAPFVDISSMTNRNTDRGLLGLAVDPDFPARPFVYLLYVFDPPDRAPDSSDPRVIRLIRMVADASKNYNEALPDSTEIILGKNSLSEWIAAPFDKNSGIIPEPASCMTGLTIDGEPVEDCLPADAKSHSAGTLIFGKDRSLYVSLGDGSSYDGTNRPALRAQMLDSLAGKILRIHPDTGEGLPGNPYFDPAKPQANRSRVWAYGMRNPFRITLDPDTGQVYSGDVGSSSWEEVNAGKGANFGWPCYEGGVSPLAGVGESGETASLINRSYANFSRTRDLCRPLYQQGEGAVRSPIFSYAHEYVDGQDQGGSITGVAVYKGTAYPPRYKGSLFIADYALRWLRFLTFDEVGKATVHDFAREVGSGLGIVDLQAGPDTNIYALYLDLKTRSSQLRRFRFLGDANIPPRVSLAATPDAGSIPLAVTFRSDGTFDPDGQELTYSWDFGDGNSSTEKHPIHVYEKVGTFTASLTVQEKSAPFASSRRRVTIRTGVTPPKAHIDAPPPGYTYKIGDTIEFSGRASFQDQTNNPNVDLSWAIIQHHNDHTHLEKEVSGASGSFVAEEHADNTWYEVCLSASAGEGQEDQTCREFFPQRSAQSFTSEPVGAKIAYVEEQIEVLAPHIANPIVGSRRTLIAAPIHADRSFISWSDGLREAQRSFEVTSKPAEYKALYENLLPTAVIKVDPGSPLTNRLVRFDGSRSSDPERSLLAYSWDFGDGGKGVGERIDHVYQKPGVYKVVLTVEDKLGGQKSSEVSVVVGAVSSLTPTPTRAATPTSGAINTPTPVPPAATPTRIATPTSAVDPYVAVRRPTLTVRARGRAPCQGIGRSCRISRGEGVQVAGRIDPAMMQSSESTLLTIKVGRVSSRSRVTIPLSLTESRTKFSVMIPGRILRRPGMYTILLEFKDQERGRVVRSRQRFVSVRTGRSAR